MGKGAGGKRVLAVMSLSPYMSLLLLINKNKMVVYYIEGLAIMIAAGVVRVVCNSFLRKVSGPTCNLLIRTST